VSSTSHWMDRLSLLGGPLLCAAILLAPTPDGLTAQGQAALAVMTLCMTWWLMTPVPLPVTSLAGLALLPAVGALPTSDALALFGNQAIFFVIGVFLVAAVMLRTGLSARLSLLFLRRLSGSEGLLCNAVLLLSWGSCLIVVSHAVAAMMLPIVLSIITALDLPARSRTARRLLLSMAWGTVAGSNLTLLSSARASLALELYGQFLTDSGQPAAPIGFLEYSLASAPISLITLLICGGALAVVFPPEGLDLKPAIARLDQQVSALGPMTRGEWGTVGVVIGMLVAMGIAGPSWLGIVALLASVATFALRIVSWEDAERYVNWGVVLMYGGAIAVGAALTRTGAISWVVDIIMPHNVPPLLVLLVVAAMVTLLTEVVSNSAAITILLPVAMELGLRAGITPRAMAWIAPIAAGFAFALPTSTPAIALVFGSGVVTMRDTVGPGTVVAVLCLAVLVLSAWLLWPLLGLAVVI
jgi:solute carrier family 13 (sodium-dependent dicarboxylate transporter), member 2/3/5